jgi:hypothetical protein
VDDRRRQVSVRGQHFRHLIKRIALVYEQRLAETTGQFKLRMVCPKIGCLSNSHLLFERLDLFVRW